jgi:hypothetical protein
MSKQSDASPVSMLRTRTGRRAFLGAIGAGGALAAVHPAITLAGGGAPPDGGQASARTAGANVDAGSSATASYLFLQSAPSGTLTPAGPNQWHLLMNGFNGTTLYFADRPARAAGEMPTDFFFKALGLFSNPKDLPNAAIVAPGQEGPDTIVVELSNPKWNPDAGTVEYDVHSLAPAGSRLDWFAGANRTTTSLPSTLKEINLFIDDATVVTAAYCNSLTVSFAALQGADAAIQAVELAVPLIPPPFGEIVEIILEIVEVAIQASIAGVQDALQDNCGGVALLDIFASPQVFATETKANAPVATSDKLARVVKARQKVQNHTQVAVDVTNPGTSLASISQIAGKPLPKLPPELNPNSSLQQTLDVGKSKAPAAAAKINEVQGHLGTVHAKVQQAHDAA